MAEKPKKQVVRAQTPATGTGAKKPATEATWKPTPEAKAQATKLRIFAWVAWAVAIGLEMFAIFWVLRQPEIKTWLLIVLIVVIGLLALGGSFLWKKANRLDPASRANKLKFFVQNQLGAIMTAIAFLPLIILVFLNKDMDGKQKGIVGGIAIAVMVVVGALSSTTNSPSVEQYSDESRIVMELTGKDEVFWTKSGKVFHLCEAASDVQRESKDNTVEVGTVGQAHAAGKERLTKKVETEIKQCGLDINNYNPNPSDATTEPGTDQTTEPGSDGTDATESPEGETTEE